MRNPLKIERREGVNGGQPIFFQRVPPSSRISVISWVGRGGSAASPRGKEGLSYLAGHLLLSGTRHRSKKELARDLDLMAATAHVDVDWDGVTVEVRGPTEFEDQLVRLLFELVTEPLFLPNEVQRVKEQQQERLERARKLPPSLAETNFLRSLFPSGHPYRTDPMGTTETVSKLGPEDVERLHSNEYVSAGSKLVVTSPGTPDLTMSHIEKVFSPMPQGSAPQWTVQGAGRFLRRSRDHDTFVIKGSQQVSVVLGGGAPPRSDPSYPELELANEILGGRPMLSRLFQMIREKEGLAYYADSTISMLRHGGYWNVAAGTSVDAVERVRALLASELARLAEKPVGTSEMRSIRESLIGSFPLATDTPESAHALAHEIACFDLPTNHYLQLFDRLRSITPQSLKEVFAQKMDGWREPITVVVGPPEIDAHGPGR